jgi:hypothetical protein
MFGVALVMHFVPVKQHPLQQLMQTLPLPKAAPIRVVVVVVLVFLKQYFQKPAAIAISPWDISGREHAAGATQP